MGAPSHGLAQLPFASGEQRTRTRKPSLATLSPAGCGKQAHPACNKCVCVCGAVLVCVGLRSVLLCSARFGSAVARCGVVRVVWCGAMWWGVGLWGVGWGGVV
eukprot:15444356-Alexandrium_andersonii.AAC.1